MTLADLTVDVDHLDRDRLLDDWRWLIGSAKRLVLVSAIGDAFLQDTDDGGRPSSAASMGWPTRRPATSRSTSR